MIKKLIQFMVRPFFALARWYERRKGTVTYKSNHYSRVTMTVVYMDRDKIHDHMIAVLKARGQSVNPRYKA